MGRLQVGTAVHLRLPDSLLAEVDAVVTRQGVNRAEAVRQLLDAQLSKTRVVTTPRDVRLARAAVLEFIASAVDDAAYKLASWGKSQRV